MSLGQRAWQSLDLHFLVFLYWDIVAVRVSDAPKNLKMEMVIDIIQLLVKLAVGVFCCYPIGLVFII